MTGDLEGLPARMAMIFSPAFLIGDTDWRLGSAWVPPFLALCGLSVTYPEIIAQFRAFRRDRRETGC